MSANLTTQPPKPAQRDGILRRLIGSVGADNLSLIFALIILILLITVVSGWFGISGGDKFFSWQNMMNSLAQAIVVVGLLAMGETVVIIAGALDISVGSIASIGSVVAASVLVGVGIGAGSFIPSASAASLVRTGGDMILEISHIVARSKDLSQPVSIQEIDTYRSLANAPSYRLFASLAAATSLRTVASVRSSTRNFSPIFATASMRR